MHQQLGRLSDSHVRLFLAIVLRNQSVFDQIGDQLTPSVFTDGGLRLVWQAATLRMQIAGRLPTGPELVADLAATPESAALELAFAEHQQAALQFVAWAYSPHTFEATSPTSDEMSQFAFQVGRLLLLRAQSDALLQQLPGTDPTALPAVLEQAQLRASAAAVFDAATPRQAVLPDGWDTRDPVEIRTTGFPFLDRYMGGGEVVGEIYLFMAPQGTCKTTFSVMKWVSSGRQAYARTFNSDYDGRIGLSFLVSYEASLGSELRHRALAYAAKIHKDRLQAMGYEGIQSLNNDPERPLPYESMLFSQQIADGLFIPERQRVQMETPWINQHLVCIDLSGADASIKNAGYGGIPEIVRQIKSSLRSSGPQYYVESIVVDYLGLMVDRHTGTLPTRERKESHESYPAALAAAKRSLAAEFRCPVWFMHQLSGEANSILNITRRMHHTQGKGAKMVGENTDFIFVVGNLNAESVGVLDCTKHRRYQPLPRTVIKIEGDFNNIVSLDGHTIDNRGRVVERATLAAAGEAAARSAPRMAGASALLTATGEEDDFSDIENG